LESSRQPAKINEGFTCAKCGTKNKPADKTCRNHCKNCLWSMHVDQVLPGDRLCLCHGLMEPVGIEYNSKKGQQIIHECQKCHTKSVNKTASDDNIEIIIKLINRSNISQNHEN